MTYIVLDTITPPTEGIVLQVEDLKTCVQVLHELADLQRPFIVS